MSATNACQTHRETIVALRDGRFDVIAPDRMETAELHLNECDACQAMLADVTPSDDPLIAATVVDEPKRGEWDAMWHRIDAAPTGGPVSDRSFGRQNETLVTAPPRLLRFVRSTGILAAAAMVLLMIGLWQAVPASASEWEFDLAGADDVEIESIQVYDDNGVPLVFSTGGGDDGVSVIWVVEESGA